MDFIFEYLRPFSATETTPHPLIFYNYRPVVIFRYAETQWCKTKTVEKSYYLTDDVNFFNFCAFNISVKLHNFVCQPRRVAAEMLIKINKHIYPRIYDFPYILPQIKPTLKGPKQ